MKNWCYTQIKRIKQKRQHCFYFISQNGVSVRVSTKVRFQRQKWVRMGIENPVSASNIKHVNLFLRFQFSCGSLWNRSSLKLEPPNQNIELNISDVRWGQCRGNSHSRNVGDLYPFPRDVRQKQRFLQATSRPSILGVFMWTVVIVTLDGGKCILQG